MALNLKNTEVEWLAAEVSRLTGESKTEAVRQALHERRQRLLYRVAPVDRAGAIRAFFESEVWPETTGA